VQVAAPAGPLPALVSTDRVNADGRRFQRRRQPGTGCRLALTAQLEKPTETAAQSSAQFSAARQNIESYHTFMAVEVYNKQARSYPEGAVALAPENAPLIAAIPTSVVMDHAKAAADQIVKCLPKVLAYTARTTWGGKFD
jgi:hypothetical protein